ncbi:MAG TPA: lysophospholipid acyltransferase family protein [Candidatus Izemoplasmatales bacterium]|nr:lysophospholipid acyltransferase family protein [Candidatus Izemoplasmatales bacterium]
MKKTRIDHQQDFLLFILRPLVYLWMWLDAKRVVHRDPSVNFHRKQPYVMLANHTYMFDVVHVPLRFRITPFIVASQTLFTNQPTKFLVTQVAHVIPKSKGKSDIATILHIFNAIKRGYPILIFPEGDTTFFGETGHIEEATMKLIKKLGVDVITCNVKGGYLSRPRWGTGKRRRHRIELNYNLAITKEQLKDMSPEDINNVVKKALYHNDYEYQRTIMAPHPGKQLAEGMENVAYVCPHCQSINSISTSGNKIHCDNCHADGYIDKYGFIHGFVYDNMIDWNNYQKGFTDKLRQTTIQSPANLFYLKENTEERVLIGEISFEYRDNEIHIDGAIKETIPVGEITNVIITLRRELQFFYDNRHFLVLVDKHSIAFLRALQDKY